METAGYLDLKLIPKDVKALQEERDRYKAELETYRCEDELRKELFQQTLDDANIKSWVRDAEGGLEILERRLRLHYKLEKVPDADTFLYRLKKLSRRDALSMLHELNENVLSIARRKGAFRRKGERPQIRNQESFGRAAGAPRRIGSWRNLLRRPSVKEYTSASYYWIRASTPTR